MMRWGPLEAIKVWSRLHHFEIWCCLLYGVHLPRVCSLNHRLTWPGRTSVVILVFLLYPFPIFESVTVLGARPVVLGWKFWRFGRSEVVERAGTSQWSDVSGQAGISKGEAQPVECKSKLCQIGLYKLKVYSLKLLVKACFDFEEKISWVLKFEVRLQVIILG